MNEKLKYFISGVLSVIGFALIAFVFFMLGKSSSGGDTQNNPTLGQLTPTTIPAPTEADVKAELDHNLKADIVAAMQTKSYASIEKYMEPTVRVRMEGENCCGLITREEAIAKLATIRNARNPWEFDQEKAEIEFVKSKDPRNYGVNSLVGIAASNQIVAFIIEDDQIIQISISESISEIGV